MNTLNTNQKLQIFFWNFSRKDIEDLCNISLESLPQTIENEMKFHPQNHFTFIEYIINKSHNDERFDKMQIINCNNIVENLATTKQIILTNYRSFIASLLSEVANEKIDANDMILHYRDKSDNKTKCYVKICKDGDKNKAYFIDEYGEKIEHLGSCENEPNY